MKINYPVGGYAPGNYQNKCITCKDLFVGDKRATQCEPCAINTLNQSHKLAITKIDQFRKHLRRIKDGQAAINSILKEDI